ncbi:hypothetical protein Tco_1210266 [Tanacetum coccineum]
MANVNHDDEEEEEDPQEEEYDMEVDIKEDENEPELTYPYEEVDPLNPPPPASEIMPPKSATMTQAAIRRMMKESVDAAIPSDEQGQQNWNC